MRVPTLFLIVLLSFMGLDQMWITDVKAQSSSTTPQEESTDITTPSPPLVNSEQTIKEDPVCDPTYRPVIQKIEPDEFQPGDKVAIIGEHLGSKKDCLHSVTFGYLEAKDFTLQGDERIEATAPDNLAPGMLFLNVETGGGAARKAVLIKKK